MHATFIVNVLRGCGGRRCIAVIIEEEEDKFLKRKLVYYTLYLGSRSLYFFVCCFTCVNGCVAFCHGCTSPCLYHILFLKDVLPFQTVLFFRHWRLSILYMYGRKVLSQKIKIKKLVYTCLDFVGKVCCQRTHSKKNELLKIITTIITASTVEGYPKTLTTLR